MEEKRGCWVSEGSTMQSAFHGVVVVAVVARDALCFLWRPELFDGASNLSSRVHLIIPYFGKYLV